MAENLVTIKKIKVGDNLHEIDAKYWGGHEFSSVEGMIHGVVDTYVIPTSKSKVNGYDAIVGSTDNTITLTQTELNNLVSVQPADANKSYKVGDIILIEEASTDSKFVFDRWVSAVGTGSNPTISLSVLETQVATHHHEVYTSVGNAYTGVSGTTTTSTVMPKVGEAVTVLAGNDSPTVVTSVSHDDKGTHNLSLLNESGEGSVGHSHTVDAHDHSVSFTPSDFINETADVYTSLNTKTYAPVSTSTVDVAGVHTDDVTLTYANGGGSTDTFVKTLKDVTSTTGGETLTTGSNTAGISTNEQESGDDVGEIVKTTSVSGHTHSVEAETTSDVVTGVTLAESVITSVGLNYTEPTVAGSVVTSVESSTTKVLSSASVSTSTSKFATNWVVEDDGVLKLMDGDAVTSASINSSSVDVLSEITPSTATQSAGSASLTKTSTEQSVTSGKVKSTCTTGSAGGHSHGFSHTHTIPAHTHTIASHTHSYNKSEINETGNAYVSLSTANYVTHKHENETVIGSVTDSNGTFTCVTGGTKTTVVKDLKASAQTYNSTSVTPTTDTKYVKLTGDITFPGLTVGTKTLQTTTVTPAVAGTEKPLKSISFTSGEFVTNVTNKTSVNIGGNPDTVN